jgi:hypothetical protein
MRNAQLILYIGLILGSQRSFGQPVAVGSPHQPGEMALVKDGGHVYGLQLATKTRYRWSQDRWEPDGGLDVRLPARRLPFMHKSQALKGSDGHWFVQATGFGHLWDYHNGSLTRLDTTFFAGSNFGADRFVYRDTVYSQGGYGFWLHHGIVSYFDPRFKEWERLITTGHEGPVLPNPIAAYAGNGVRWVWSVSDYPEQGGSRLYEPDGTVYALDLKNRKLEPVGHVRRAIWREIGKPIAAWDSVVLTSGTNGALLVNMSKNEVRRIPADLMYGNSLGPLDAWGSGCAVLDDTLEVFTTKDRARSNILVHNRFALRDLWEQSEPLGAFVEPKWLNGLKRNYWLPLLTVLIGLGAWLLGRSRPVRPVGPTAFARELDLYERKLLLPLLLEGPERKWTSHELDELLETADKSWDNQRKIRKTTINDLNRKALLHLELSLLISDERDAEDRREKRYFVVPEILPFKRDLVELLQQAANF